LLHLRTMFDNSPHGDLGSGTEPLDKTLRREIHIARNIQMTLLNGSKPKLAAGEVSGVSIPARLIGGDYFDFYSLANGKIRIVIGDVMGKGIPAAMLMILTRGAFRSASVSTKSPGETLTAMNNALFPDLRKLGSFVTVFCADWDPFKRMLSYANAGHNLPVILRGYAREVPASPVKGVMLGGLPNQTYRDERMRLEADDLVFFYTDGIVEAMNAAGEMFRLERLISTLAACGRLQAEDIERSVVEAVNRFTEGLPQKDDITMVTLKVGQDRGTFPAPNGVALFL